MEKTRNINIPAFTYEEAMRVFKDGFNLSEEDILNYVCKDQGNGFVIHIFTVKDTRSE